MLFNRKSQQRDEEAMEWLMRLVEREARIQEAFYAWLLGSPRNVRAFLGVAMAYRRLDGLDAQRRIDVDRLIAESEALVVPVHRWRRGAEEASAQPKRATGRWRLAASIAAIALIAGAVGYELSRRTDENSTYRTAVGEQREVKLEDGSLIRMNTSSRLHVAYARDKREIRLLAGEALFVVARDARRPFLVVADQAIIRAVGTEFNVYRRAGVTTVSVLEGAVQISAAKVPTAAMPKISAGEQAVAHGDRIVKIATPDVDRSVAWRRRELVFKQTPLAEVAAEFNRYNRRQLRLSGDGLGERQISGRFSADYPQSLILFLEKDSALEVRDTADAWIVQERDREDGR